MRFLIDWLKTGGDRVIAQNKAEAARLYPNFRNVTADRDDWKTFYIAGCESPAEVAFLRAMMARYEFSPNEGVLISPSMKMSLQVKVADYRLDFLIDDWLIIEIDGAAWHSSPEAIEKDRKRDEYFVNEGYSVLRIPASVVFNNSQKAVRLVEASYAQRRRNTVKSTVSAVEVNKPRMTFRGVLNSVHNAVKDMNNYLTEASEQQRVESEYRKSDEYRAKLIAEQEAEAQRVEALIDEKFPPGSKDRELYDAAYDDLSSLFDEKCR